MTDPTSPPTPTGQAPEPPLRFDIGDEFGTAKRNLPPARIVVVCLAAVAFVLGVFAYMQRQKPQGAGSIDGVNVVDVPGQNRVLVAVTVTLRNVGKKPLWVRTLQGVLTAADAKSYEDPAASAVDFDRYYAAFPSLKLNTRPALYPEAKIMPGDMLQGTMIVSFPVTKEAYDQKKSLAVRIQPYDQVLPVVLTQ
jgi:hypothetical protein